jgi:hypothetical protein
MIAILLLVVSRLRGAAIKSKIAIIQVYISLSFRRG